jgi:hypothetical protein
MKALTRPRRPVADDKKDPGKHEKPKPTTPPPNPPGNADGKHEDAYKDSNGKHKK